MASFNSVLGRPDGEIAADFIAGHLDVNGNDDVLRRVFERMWVELDGFHRLLWLWSDMRIGGEFSECETGETGDKG